MKISGLILVGLKQPNILQVGRSDGQLEELSASEKVMRFASGRQLVGRQVALYFNEGGEQVGLVGRIELDLRAGPAKSPTTAPAPAAAADANPAAADVLADLNRKLAGD